MTLSAKTTPEDAVDQSPPELGIFDREHDLDAAAKVARHPVGRGEEDFRLVAIFEISDPRMLEVFVDDADDPDIVRDAWHPRPQAADAADDQVDLYARLRGSVQQGR